MTFVTKLRFQSGDRAVLEDTVGDLKDLLQQKGVESKGPHARPSRRVRAPLYATLEPGDRLGDWGYEVYVRELEIHGGDAVAREIAESGFHDAVHVEMELERKTPLD